MNLIYRYKIYVLLKIKDNIAVNSNNRYVVTKINYRKESVTEMGLAASQARFLAITARKNNCEFQSMQIAQEKLSITRDQQKAAQDYQNSLSATKLCWDTADDSVYDLSYDLMMKPSALNEYDPYLITDAQGKLVLSEKMFQAAVDAKIIDEKTGDPIANRSMGAANSQTDGSRNAFLYQLGVYNQADAATINSIIKLKEQGYTDSGVGGEIIDKTLANSFTTNAFINYLKEATYPSDVTDSSGAVVHKKGDLLYSMNLKDIFSAAGVNLTTSTTLQNNEIVVTKNGQAITDPKELEKLTLGDIVDGRYSIAGRIDAAKMEDVATKILDEMATLLGWNCGPNTTKGINVDDESNDALQRAYEFTKALLNSTQTSSSNGAIVSSSVNNAISKSEQVNNIVQGTNGITSISLSNMLKSFLTYFAIATVGYEYGVNVDADSSADSSYITDDVGFNFIVANQNAMTSQDLLNADFYNMLYNQLCMNGATTDKMKQQMVTDPEYLNHALKNGQLFISTLNNDGYFYQGHYTASGHVVEVTDDDAVAQAEAEYNVKKSQLNYKEETLEVKLKNIDTELSALTTEYDTVKNLISKNVEKVFTMFST